MMVIVGGVIPPQDFDALRDAGAKAIFPPGTVPDIVYSVAVPKGRQRAETSAFMAYLTGPQARAAFRAQGFVVLPGPGR